MSMFCYQCQETAGNKSCQIKGVCGKSESTALLQDLLVWRLKGLCQLYAKLKPQGSKAYNEIAGFVAKGLFMTITNANFDDRDFVLYLDECQARIAAMASGAGAEILGPRAQWPEAASWSGMATDYAAKAATVGLLTEGDEDIRSLTSLALFGLKGLSAYLHHAAMLGFEKPSIMEYLVKAMAKLADPPRTAGELTEFALEIGAQGFLAMELLDQANTSSFGQPRLTEVNIGVGNRPGILVSGHDLRDLAELLEQSQGKGVDVYTHSEMLPAHSYPELRKYEHLKGNYGSAWWKQKEDFAAFNGPILMTTNCIVTPADSYKDRLYVTGAAGYPGAMRIADRQGGKAKNFQALIKAAQACQAPTPLESGTILGGLAHNQVLALADKVVAAVRAGKIRKFVVMAGCDGRQGIRSYYTDFAKALAKDCVILTAGCAKYRYNKLGLGDIEGIPRVLDAGQCNDSYSLIKVALALKDVFNCADVNQLPIAYNIAWYEQKAVIVLLALLSLGVKNIHLGPSIPAFLSPNVAKVIVDAFGLAPIGTVEADLASLGLA